MNQPRTLLLFDPGARPQGWNERMKPGEYAILYSSLRLGSDPENREAMREPFCSVFSTLADAEVYAAQQVALLPTLGCRIYDHNGLGRQPIREIRGIGYKGEEEISPRFRRWWGYGLFLGGMVLLVVDWRADFGLLWPAMFATRMMPIGLLLLVTELVISIEARRQKKSRRTIIGRTKAFRSGDRDVHRRNYTLRSVLTLALVGLPPTEYASLRLDTHSKSRFTGSRRTHTDR